MATDTPSISDSTSYSYPFEELPRPGDVISVHPTDARRPRIGLAWGLNNTQSGLNTAEETFQYIDIRFWEILLPELRGADMRAERSYIYNRYSRPQVHPISVYRLEDDAQKLFNTINEELPPRSARSPIKLHTYTF